VRSLYLRNREYRERIEGQKNLVVLGSAASTLAHEIKNPLLAIRIQTGLLEKLYAGQGGDELRIINEEVDRLSALSYRIGDYLRDPRGNPEVLAVYDALRETAERLTGRGSGFVRSLETRSLETRPLEASPPEGPPPEVLEARVFADPERLRSVFENLIRNALESGGKPEEAGASISAVPGSGRVMVTVFDRGRGVAPEDLGRVFDPFFTRKSAGTGMGLAICRRFAEAAGGSLSLENREGGGALVRLSLPAASGPPQGAPGTGTPATGGR
jgi:two-component system sensor histidine kinase HydH